MMARNLIRLQQEYLSVIEKHEGLIRNPEPKLTSIGQLFDDINFFWRKNLNIIEIEIDYLTQVETCMILSGAAYIDYSNNDHYLYKSLGQQHFLHDSFLKFEHIFRLPPSDINIQKNFGIIKRVFEDTLLVLREIPNTFFYVPLNLIIESRRDDWWELLNKAFWDFISSIFNKEIRSEEEFIKEYSTYGEIEKAIGPSGLKNLIFTDESDYQKSLKLRVEQFLFNSELEVSSFKQKSDSSRFLTAVFSYVGQIMDILYVSTYFNLYPFIRYNVAFHYFILFMHAFLHDKKLKSIIEKTIVTYIFYRSTDKELLTRIGFQDYCKRLGLNDFLNIIITRMKEQNIDIVNGGISKVVDIINAVFSDIWNEK